MNLKNTGIAAIMSLSASQAASAQSPSASQQASQHRPETRQHKHERTRASAKVSVHDSDAKPFDQTTNPTLLELQLNETFTGDIEGESTVRALQIRRADHSASMVSLQRFDGKLAQRKGTFVLQGTEEIENGKIKASWFVVPRSATGELSGLRGEGGFEGDFGKGSTAWLDYWFE